MSAAATVAGVRLSHPERVLYPEQGITKQDLATYYVAVAELLLPELRGRPLSLVRCPAGEGGTCFFQKHFSGDLPVGLAGVRIAEKLDQATYATVMDLRGLISLVQIGVLELHPWGSTTDHLEQPDRMIFDFDPDPQLPWARVIEAALDMRDFLQGLGLAGFPKTTGGKGLHVVVPIAPRLDWSRVAAVAQAIAGRLAQAKPKRYTTALAKAARTGLVFIDYLRNNRGSTAIAPYSPRARAGAPVATPVSWAEVEAGIDARGFTVRTVPQRLAELGTDPWAELASLRQALSPALLRELGV
jgi:bifunctional non-homologous end joining protein LigD